MTIQNLSMLLGLSFFLGLSFEGFYWQSARSRPGGIRTFPLLSFCGAILYSIEPHFAAAFCVGLIVLGAWLYPYYQAEVVNVSASQENYDGLMVPLCNLVAYILGPVTLTQPPWIAVGLTVAAVVLLRARERLHGLANRLPAAEIFTFAQFLLLIGVVLPLLPKAPVTTWTAITPFQVWLAVVVVSSLSYGSYLLQKLVPGDSSLLLTSVLGGLYSSTATTVVLSRKLAHNPAKKNEIQAGIVLATSLMYLRLGVVVAIFNLPLALILAPSLVGLSMMAALLGAWCWWWGGGQKIGAAVETAQPSNPLELSAALIFAVLFVVVSIASSWVTENFGHIGVYFLAAIVGVTDIDPFVLSVAQGGVRGLEPTAIAVSILIAASSNNILKSFYCISFGSIRSGFPVATSLTLLSATGIALAWWSLSN